MRDSTSVHQSTPTRSRVKRASPAQLVFYLARSLVRPHSDGRLVDVPAPTTFTTPHRTGGSHKRRTFIATLPALTVLAVALLWVPRVNGADEKSSPSAGPVSKGQRVFTCGHSFHYWIPGILSDMAKWAGIEGHEAVGLSAIGGSRVIQHWNVPDEKNKAKAALRDGKVDVLTLSPMHQPDEGIEKFAELGLKGNPNIRVTIQEFWIPFDIMQWPYQRRKGSEAFREALRYRDRSRCSANCTPLTSRHSTITSSP